MKEDVIHSAAGLCSVSTTGNNKIHTRFKVRSNTGLLVCIRAIERRTALVLWNFSLISFTSKYFLTTTTIYSKTILPVFILLWNNLSLISTVISWWLHFSNRHCLDVLKRNLYNIHKCNCYLCSLLSNKHVKKKHSSEIPLTLILLFLLVSIPNLLCNRKWNTNTFLLCTLASWDETSPTHIHSLQLCRVI